MLIKILECLLAGILCVRRLLCPKVAVLPGPNMSWGEEAFLSHVSLLMDSAREFFSDAKIHIDLLIISGKKVLLGSLIWLCFACLFYYFLTFFPILSISFFFFFYNCYRRCCSDCAIVAFKNITRKNNNMPSSVKVAAWMATIWYFI